MRRLISWPKNKNHKTVAVLVVHAIMHKIMQVNGYLHYAFIKEQKWIKSK